MPEPFKNVFNKVLIELVAHHLARVAQAGEFDAQAFMAEACNGLDELELRDRSRQITRALQRHLPDDFTRACELLVATLHPDEQAALAEQVPDAQGLRGWAIMPIADFVAAGGLEQFDLAMQALAHCTKRFTAEFAVRPFIIDDLERAIGYLHQWAQAENVHLRRLASEGARPRLPWGVHIPALIKNPEPLLPVLELLRDDSSDYVRRSVANHLNDIAKDHPKLVGQIASQWWIKAPPARQRLVRHACRSLIKQGDRDVLAVLGYHRFHSQSVQLQLSATKVHVGDSLQLQCILVSASQAAQEAMLDYVVHFRLGRGRIGKQVFKWKTFTLAAHERKTVITTHCFRKITTRRLYPGMHKIELQLNGEIVAAQAFELLLPHSDSVGTSNPGPAADIKNIGLEEIGLKSRINADE